MQGTARFTRTIIARGMSPATYSAHAFVQRLPVAAAVLGLNFGRSGHSNFLRGFAEGQD